MAEFREEYEICRSVLSDLDELVALSEGLHGGLDYLDFVFPHWVHAEEAENSGGEKEGGRWRNLTLRVRDCPVYDVPTTKGEGGVCSSADVCIANQNYRDRQIHKPQVL